MEFNHPMFPEKKELISFDDPHVMEPLPPIRTRLTLLEVKVANMERRLIKLEKLAKRFTFPQGRLRGRSARR